MALMSHSSYESGTSSKKEIMKLKKDIWCNEKGECAESNEGLPKGWNKGKLMGRAGQEMNDADYKALKFVTTKAKAPKENKAK